MFARNLLVVAGFALAGVAAQAATSTAPVGDASNYPAYAPSTSTLTRAEVQAQVVQAQRNGTMAMRGDQVTTYNGQYPQTSSLSRAQVQAEAAAALRAGHLSGGEGVFGE